MIIPILTAVILSLCLALPASAYDVDYGKVSISIENAPKGTAYVDFLVRKKDIPKAHAKKQDYKIQKKISYYTGTGERINNTSSKGGYTIDEELLGRMEKDCWIDAESETNFECEMKIITASPNPSKGGENKLLNS